MDDFLILHCMSINLSRCRNCFACSAVHLFVAVPVPFVHPSRNSFVIVVDPRPIIESFAPVSARRTLNRPLNVFVHCCSVLYSSNWRMAAARIFNKIARGFSCTSAPPHVYSSNRKPNHRGSHKKRSYRCLHTTSSRLLLNRTKCWL